MDAIRSEIGAFLHGASALGAGVYGDYVSLPLTRRIFSSLFRGYPTRPTPIGANDHVIFTGVMWTPAYQQLFRQLHSTGVRFSVLVYDIIPIERPDLVVEAHRERFIKWLKMILSKATVIFVSSHSMIDKLRKCSVIFDIRIKARLVQIYFGTTTLLESSPRQLSALVKPVQQRPENGFVLSVGTIDKRKNQSLLVEIWGRLISEGYQDLPRLVLLGRLDVDLDALSPEGKRAIDSGMVQILRDQPDEVVANLYRDCLFTVFPSFIEGYGLPVVESLRFGKLCVCSDLAEIREFAGDLVWYFDPTNPESAYRVIRTALASPAKRQKTEREIARRFVPQPWSSTFLAMVANIQSVRI
jgi:glycosyltransferase involved in cell wall biosynthesis